VGGRGARHLSPRVNFWPTTRRAWELQATTHSSRDEGLQLKWGERVCGDQRATHTDKSMQWPGWACGVRARVWIKKA
jgi:hypothetical protein